MPILRIEFNKNGFMPHLRNFLSVVMFSSLMVNFSYATKICNHEADEIIKLAQLQPLEFEGGYFKQTYKLDNRTNHSIPKTTAIFFLLKAGDKSRLHKLSNDEIYHFYAGDPIRMLQLNPNGSSRTLILGSDILHGQQVQVIVPKNTWQGSEVVEGGCYGFVGTTMTPGFDISEFELGKRQVLLAKYPNEKELITRLTD